MASCYRLQTKTVRLRAWLLILFEITAGLHFHIENPPRLENVGFFLRTARQLWPSSGDFSVFLLFLQWLTPR